jgi:mutator protein MutT
MIDSGYNVMDASRGTFRQAVNLSEVPFVELESICQEAMKDFRERKAMGNMKERNIEREKKFQIVGRFSDVEDFLGRNGFTKRHAERQKDVYWDDESYTITNHARGLRVRYVGGHLKSVQFKSLFIDESGERVIEEVDLLRDGMIDRDKLGGILAGRFNFTARSAGKSLEGILASYGLRSKYTIDKERSVYMNDDGGVEVAVDNIEGIAPHVEIEHLGGDGELYQTLVDEMQGMEALEEMARGYVELVVRDIPEIYTSEKLDAFFQQDPAWNVLPSERALVRELFGRDKKERLKNEKNIFRATVYAIIRKDDDILISRRYNTGHSDGMYILPAGHINKGESAVEALVREAREELGISVRHDDVRLAHVMQHEYPDESYFHLYFEIKKWRGEPRNLEPDECDDLRWVNVGEVNDFPLLDDVRVALENIEGDLLLSNYVD